MLALSALARAGMQSQAVAAIATSTTVQRTFSAAADKITIEVGPHARRGDV